jgi:hypothetical protein
VSSHDGLALRCQTLAGEIGSALSELVALATDGAQPNAGIPAGATDTLRACARQLHEERRFRLRFFPADLFAEHSWDMLLDVFIADMDGKRLTATAVCAGSDVALTTGLRWLRAMERMGLIERVLDPVDRRCQYIVLKEAGRSAMRLYLCDLLERRSRSSPDGRIGVPAQETGGLSCRATRGFLSSRATSGEAPRR